MNYNTFGQRFRHAVYIMKTKSKAPWRLVVLAFIAALVISAFAPRIIALPITVGISAGIGLVCLKTVRNEETSPADVFAAFRDFKSVKRVIGGSLWATLTVSVWIIVPIAAYYILAAAYMGQFSFNISPDELIDSIYSTSSFNLIVAAAALSLFYFACAVVYLVKTLEIAFVPYILLTRDDVGTFEACKESKRLTSNIKGRIFMFTFLPSLLAVIILAVLMALSRIPYIGSIFAVLMAAFTIVCAAVLPYYANLGLAGFYEAALHAPEPQYGHNQYPQNPYVYGGNGAYPQNVPPAEAPKQETPAEPEGENPPESREQ